MPGFVRNALKARGLMAAFRERPAYQQNDYIGWINRARRRETMESGSARCRMSLNAAGFT